MWLSIDTFQILMSCAAFIVRMSLLNIESCIFLNVFYLVLFYIHVCVDDVIEKKLKIWNLKLCDGMPSPIKVFKLTCVKSVKTAALFSFFIISNIMVKTFFQEKQCFIQ